MVDGLLQEISSRKNVWNLIDTQSLLFWGTWDRQLKRFRLFSAPMQTNNFRRSFRRILMSICKSSHNEPIANCNALACRSFISIK
jgi:hypothetical protein